MTKTGVVMGAVAAIHDISDIRAAEAQLIVVNEQLVVQSQLLQSVFNAISDGVVVTDETGQVIMFNPSARQLTGSGLRLENSDQWFKEYTCFYPDRVTPFPPEEHPIIRAYPGGFDR